MQQLICPSRPLTVQGGVSFELLDQKLPVLHIPNVLYQRGETAHVYGKLPVPTADYVFSSHEPSMARSLD